MPAVSDRVPAGSGSLPQGSAPAPADAEPMPPSVTRAAVGVDLGGTKIAAAVVDEHARILARATVATPAQEGPAAVLDAAAESVRQALRSAPVPDTAVLGVGIGSAGVIDPVRGTVVSATSALKDWAGTALCAELAARLRGEIPALGGPGSCLAVNDVHAHALGEAHAGAARGAASALLVAFGTGVGGCFVLNGRVLTGHRSAAGHLGHLPSPAAAGIPCTCGAQGHLEAVASGPAVHAAFVRSVRDAAPADTRGVFELARAGSPEARRIIGTAAAAAGEALAGVANTLDPEAVVISGGLAGSGELWWTPLRQAFAAGLIPALRDLEPVPAALGPDAAVLGAASLILNPSAPEEIP